MYDYVEMESTYGQKRTLLLKTKFFWLIDSISKFNTNDSSDITYPMFSCRKSFLILLCIERRGGIILINSNNSFLKAGCFNQLLCSVEEIFLLDVLRHQRKEFLLETVGKVECTVKNLVREGL